MICEFCEKTFYNKSTLSRHLNICKRKEIAEIQQQHQEQKTQYEEQLQNQQIQYEQQIQSLTQQYEQQIQQQQKQIEKLESQIFEIAKQPKITNNNNHKTHNQRTVNIINQLAPYNLDSDKIQALIQQKLTEKVILGGPEQIAKFTVDTLLTDTETGKKMVVCTDKSRKSFKYINDKQHIKTDTNLQKTYKAVKHPLVHANDQLRVQLKEENRLEDYHRDKHRENEDFLMDNDQFTSKMSQYLVLTDQ